MQELNELKNLVIQSLEANGSLSNIRAQIRASVFKVIDQQDNTQAVSKKPSPFSWENPKCQKLMENENGVIILQLIKEFLQFYSMDYSNSVFSSECNLRDEVKRDKLITNLSFNKNDTSKPLLLQLIEEYKAGNGPSQSAAPSNSNISAQQQENKKQQELQSANQKSAPTSGRSQNEQSQQQQQQQQQPVPNKQTQYQDLIGDDDFEQSLDSQSDNKPQTNNQNRPMNSPQNDEKSVQSLESTSEKKVLEEAQQFIQKSKNQMHTGQIGQLSVNQQQQSQQQANVQQQQQQNKFNPNQKHYDQEQFENYEDEDGEGVEEQLHDYQEDIDVDDDILNSKSKNAGASNQSHFEESEDYIGQSSKGHDISVDSYALENFDYIENVEEL